MQITPVRWTETGRVALLMFTRSRRMRNSGIRSWGLVHVGPARMLAMAMVNSTRAPGTGDRRLGLAPKVGPAVLFQHTYP